MAITNTKKTALFIKSGAILPVPTEGYVETTEPVLVTPTFATVDINRITGKLNAKTSVVDLCRTTTSFDASSIMRSSNAAADALDTPPPYAPLLLAAGFDEAIDTATPSEETVTYTNNNDYVDNVSAVAYLDGNKFEMTGSLICGTSMNLTVGEPAVMTNSFQGFMDSATPTAEANPAVTQTEEPVLIVSCADLVLLDGTCLAIKTAAIAMGEEVSELYTMGGASCGLKTNIMTDYALTLDLTFFVDNAEFGREAALIEAGLAKEVIIKLGLDSASAYVSGKSLEIKCSLAKAVTYSDTSDTDLLSRTLSLRLFDGITPAIALKTGFLV